MLSSHMPKYIIHLAHDIRYCNNVYQLDSTNIKDNNMIICSRKHYGWIEIEFSKITFRQILYKGFLEDVYLEEKIAFTKDKFITINTGDMENVDFRIIIEGIQQGKNFREYINCTTYKITDDYIYFELNGSEIKYDR